MIVCQITYLKEAAACLQGRQDEMQQIPQVSGLLSPNQLRSYPPKRGCMAKKVERGKYCDSTGESSPHHKNPKIMMLVLDLGISALHRQPFSLA